MSVLTSTLKKLGCTVHRFVPSLIQHAKVCQPSFKTFSVHSLIDLSHCKTQSLNIYPDVQRFLNVPKAGFHTSPSLQITLEYMHRKGLYKKERKKKKSPLDGRPQMRGVVLKTLIKKPKKPNSANRKCVRLRLTNGKEVTAYVPGEGHNLQEHNIVLVQGGRLQDTPGVKLVCVRGKYDLTHVKKK